MGIILDETSQPLSVVYQYIYPDSEVVVQRLLCVTHYEWLTTLLCLRWLPFDSDER